MTRKAAPFRSQAIAMAQRGMRPGLIAAEFGVAPTVIYQLLKDARRAGADIPRFTGGPIPRPRDDVQIRVRITPSSIARLDRAAAARDITRPELARRLLEIVAADGMIDNVLDDGVAADG